MVCYEMGKDEDVEEGKKLSLRLILFGAQTFIF